MKAFYNRLLVPFHAVLVEAKVILRILDADSFFFFLRVISVGFSDKPR